MKAITKYIFLFFLFIISLIFISRLSVVNAQSCAGTNPCTRTITGYPLNTMCVNIQTKVNVTNLPAGKNVYLACDGDYGEGYVRNKQMQNGVCVGTYCSGYYGGCAGQNWCVGDIKQAIAGSNSGPVTTSTSSVVPLIHCSCSNATVVGGQPNSPNLGCLQVSVSSTAPTMNNACNNYNPTVANVVTPQSLGCTVSGGMCGTNGNIYYPTVSITCPINGACAATHYNCTSGTPANFDDTRPDWNWDCLGSGGGTNAIGCAEPMPTLTPVPPSPTPRPPSPTPSPTPVPPSPTPSPRPTPTPRPTATPTPVPTATPTLVPHATTLDFVVGLDGIGTTGDQVNPRWQEVTGQPGTGSTLAPAHPRRPVKVTLVSSASASTEFQGEIVYDNTVGDRYYGQFKATQIDLGHTPTGVYSVYVTVAAHLTKLLGSMTITAGTENTVPGDPKGLVAGDIVGGSIDTIVPNNQLTIEDYNVLISCEDTYTNDNHATCGRNGDFPKLSDLDDNGTATTPKIDEFDYNLWVREFSKTSSGDNPAGTTQSTIQAVETTIVSATNAALTGVVTPTITGTPTVTVEPNATLTPTVVPTVAPTTAPTSAVTPTVTPAPTTILTPTVTPEPIVTTAPTITPTP